MNIDNNNDNNHNMTDIQYIDSSELDSFEASKSLNRKFKRRKSQLDLERQGIVPPNYFNDPIAATLAQTLVTSVHHQHDNNNNNNNNDNIYQYQQQQHNEQEENITDIQSMHNIHNNNDDDEWQISFVYDAMQNFVPMNPAQNDQIAMDLLEGFFPNREDIDNLTNHGIMDPDYADTHNNESNTASEAPSIVDLGDRGLIPESWLLDLYGLADETRKKHTFLECAVSDLKTHLNIKPVLADVVANDILDEIETVDPYLYKLEEEEVVNPMLDFKLEELKKLENDTKYAVFGFVRKCVILLGDDNNPYYNIPQLVYWLILSYYHWIRPCKCGHNVAYYHEMLLDKEDKESNRTQNEINID